MAVAVAAVDQTLPTMGEVVLVLVLVLVLVKPTTTGRRS
jgi:hypothetical protein